MNHLVKFALPSNSHRWQGGAVGVVVALKLQGSWFDLELNLLFVQPFTCSPYVYVDFFQVLQIPPTSQKTC